jgi:hypothetical protein
VSDDIVIMPIIIAFFAWFVWVVFSTIRRYKMAKLQAELQHGLL